MSLRRAAIVACAAALLLGNAPAGKLLASIDLQRPFATTSPWRFTARQLPEVVGETDFGGNQPPGKIVLCVSADEDRTCVPSLDPPLRWGSGQFAMSDVARFLNTAHIVHPSTQRPLLLLSVAGGYSGDGDQAIGTRLLDYDRAKDRFVDVFNEVTGHNNNEQIRYIERGPLQGAVVSAEPTSDAPFGFWIVVNRLRGAAYHPILRYRSATHYNDGNPLAVIDSEMPTIQRRLGLWKPGQPLPLPAGRCPRPHLVEAELWCS